MFMLLDPRARSLAIIAFILRRTKSRFNCQQRAPGPLTGTPLHEAIRRNDVEAAERLMADPALIDARDTFGNTPLLAALSPGSALEPHGVVDASAARARIQKGNAAQQTIVSALLTRKASVTQPEPGEFSL